MGWLSHFRYSGKDRTITIRLDEIDALSRLTFSGISAIVEGQVAGDLIEPGAKLYVKTLKLARGRIERSYAQRIAQFAAEIEDRFRDTKR